jgi:multidrug resistance efflux pump
VSRPGVFSAMVTLLLVAAACVAGWAAWQAYVAPPWTRDGTVRAHVVTLAPQVSGVIAELPARDNARVAVGQLLMVIDPTDFAIAVENAQAALEQAEVNARNRAEEARRRAALSQLTTSEEEKQNYAAQARAAAAAVNQARAMLAQAKVNLSRTRIVSPVNGYITNLQTRLGDYARAGERAISIVDADSYWIDAYFEETALPQIRVGDRARMRLMGWHVPATGHVQGIARGIEVANAASDQAGLASVNPIFTWVRLAQRVPVHIDIDTLPPGMVLVAGQTASVEIVPGAEGAPGRSVVGTPEAAR